MHDETDIPVARSLRAAGDWSGAAERCTLAYDARLLRRRRLTTDAGRAFVVDLPQTRSLDAGDALELSDGTLVEVHAADEALIAVTGADLVRIAWHVGNRHAPCQVGTDRLLVQDERVMAAMLRQLGATLHAVREPFRPEGGAYGHGRTQGHHHGEGHHGHDGHGHDHGHRHDHHGHDGYGHYHSHDHGHDHGHDHRAGQEHGGGHRHGTDLRGQDPGQDTRAAVPDPAARDRC